MRWHNYISLVLLAAIAFSGCQNNLIDVNPPVAGSVNSYAWKTSGSLEYTVEANGIVSTMTLQFARTSEPNEYLVNQSIAGNFLSLHLLSTQDTMSISGLNANSIIPVPSDYVMTKTKIDTTLLFPNIKHIFAFDTTFVASDSVSVYYRADGQWVRSTSLQERVVAFSRWSALVVAVTSSGNLFFSSNLGKSWTQSVVAKTWSGAITAVYFDGASLYFAAGSSLYKLPQNKQITIIDSGLPRITSISRFIPDLKDTLLLIGTESNGLYYYSHNDSATHFILGPNQSDHIYFITPSNGGSLLIGSSSGLYSTSIRDSFELIDARLFVRSVYADTYFLIDNSGLLYTFSLGQVSPFALPSASNNINDIASSSKGKLVLASDQGIFSRTNSGGSGDWVQDSSIAEQVTKTTTTTLPMRLLVGTLDTGKTWNAGTMEFGGKLLNITATVTDYFDSIKLTNGVTFSSIYTVKYTLSDVAGARKDFFPEWLIYYAKGEGPILIDERTSNQASNSEPISRIYRTTR